MKDAKASNWVLERAMALLFRLGSDQVRLIRRYRLEQQSGDDVFYEDAPEATVRQWARQDGA